MSNIEDPEHPCPFCAIAAGRGHAREIMRTADVIAFLPDVPAVPGHTLVVPQAHVRDIWEIDARTGHLLADATRRVATAVARATQAEGMNIIQSNGVAAGQSVFHLHIHVVPRHTGDRIPELWPPDADWSDIELDSIASTIRTSVDELG
ncbi:HIT family protein [Rhodococcus aetherivorans]